MKLPLDVVLRALKDEEAAGKYRALTGRTKAEVRAFYAAQMNVPADSSAPLYCGDVQVSTGFDRVVIGDHGAYIEISPDKIIHQNIEIPPSQRFRLKNAMCKYIWMVPVGRDEKIYKQTREVSYADYKVGMYYIGVTTKNTC